MAIFRGTGGSGVADDQATINEVAEDSLAAQTAASEAASSASSASSSASSASSSASAAAASASAAQTAQAAAEAAQESIDGLYLGALSSDPTLDGNGDPVTTGDWYFNTTSNQTRIYDGSAWEAMIVDVIDDTSPQLGGDLDLNSYDITGTGNIDITGNITVSGTVDGVDIQTLNSTAGSALQNVVEDTSPELGGNLDLNFNNIVGRGQISISGNTTSQDELVTRFEFKDNASSGTNDRGKVRLDVVGRPGSVFTTDFPDFYIRQYVSGTTDGMRDRMQFDGDTGAIRLFDADGDVTFTYDNEGDIETTRSVRSHSGFYSDQEGDYTTNVGQFIAINDEVNIGSNTSTPVVFKVGNLEKARLTTDGYLGINTSTPASELDVNGDIRAIRFSAYDTGSVPFTYVGGSSHASETQIIGGETVGGVSGGTHVLGYGAKIRAGDYYYATDKIRSGGYLSFSNNSSAGHLVTLSGGDVWSGVTDLAGGNIQIIGGASTGTASGGSITFKTYDGIGNSSGTTYGTLTTALTIDQTGTATFGNDIKLGDNDKAIFGAGSDLQIYHDGSKSIIHDNGAGQLLVRTNQFNVNNAGNTEKLIEAIENAQVDLYYNNNLKLATTSTGIDVTGTVTADGLTVSTGDSIELSGGSGELIKSPSAGLIATESRGSFSIFTDVNNNGGATGDAFVLFDGDTYSGGTAKRLLTTNKGGDISFYEDTGTTAKFFWDASAESLGIGTSSPETTLHVQSSTASLCVSDGTYPNDRFLAIDVGISGSEDVQYITVDQADSLAFGEKTNNHDRAIVNEHMRIDSSGNVGIGTSSPTYSLDVDGIGRFRGITGGNSAYFGLLSNDAYTKVDFLTDELNNTCYFIAYGSTNAESGNVALKNNTGDIFFATSNSERMRIDSSGNVGIKESNPVEPLEVSRLGGTKLTYPSLDGNTTAFFHCGGGSATSGSQIAIGTGNQGQGAITFVDTDDSNPGQIMYTHIDDNMLFRVNDAEAMRIDSSGNVGIGTSSPSAVGSRTTTNIKGSAGAALRLSDDTANLYLDYTDTTGGRLFVNASEPMTFGTSSLERMRIDSSGKVLINTTSANYSEYLKVNGGTGGYAIHSTKGATSSQGHIVFSNPNGAVGTIFTSATATQYNTSSDYRLKEDWQPMSGSIDRVKALNPVNFAWKADGSRVDGFLAHEAQEVVPEAVTGTKDAVDAEGNPDYQGIDQSKLTPLLTAALKDTIAMVEELQAEVSALKAQLNG